MSYCQGCADRERDLAAARARLDEVLRLGREMRDKQRRYYHIGDANEARRARMQGSMIEAEASFDAALSPGDNAAGS